MRYVCLTAGVVLAILTSSAIVRPAAAQSFTITNFQVVSSQVITPTQSRVTYRADIVNGNSTFASVSATANTTNPFIVRIVPGQDTLNFAPVPSNSQVTSQNTITILLNPAVPFSASDLAFTFQAVAGPLSANAGPNQVATVGSTVTLNGSASTSPGGLLTYNWAFLSLPPNSTTVLKNPASVMPTFVVDVPGTYVIQLTVSSGGASSSALTMVTTGNVPPVANAGPNQTVLVGANVKLNGGGSFDVNGDPLTFAWFLATKPTGSQAVLMGAATVDPTFVADVAGNYVIQLLVNDGVLNSNLATVVISTVSSPPVANAGPNQVVEPNALVQLNGAGSTDQDGNLLTYRWSFNSIPAESKAALSNPASVNPTFTADLPGLYVVQLVVNDGGLNSAPATVSIAAQGPLAPVANAGPNQTVKFGSTVMLSGSGTDPENLPLTFSWSLSKPAGSKAVLSSTTITNPTFVADIPGTYLAQLIVSDANFSSLPATAIISSVETPPVANAGVSENVPVLATVLLNGSASTDSNGQPLTYAWTFLSIPAGSAAKLNGATSVSPMFVADLAGTYVVQLIVNDGFENSAPATVTITAAQPAISLSPNPVTLVTGPATLTVTLSAPAFPSGGQVINLSSSNPSAAIVPATVTIPQGSTGANVMVSPGGAIGTTIITASAPGFSSATATVNSTIASIILPVGVTVAPGQSASFPVILATPSASGTFVSLSTSNSNIVTVSPSFFIIPAGATTPFVQPQVTGVASGSATITASSSGLTSSSQVVNVGGAGAGSGSGLSPSALVITGTARQSLTLTISTPAPAGGLTINVSVDNPKVASVPATVSIAAGSTTTTIPVTGVAPGSTVVHASDLPVLADTTATVTVVGQPQVILPAFLIIGQWGYSGPMPVSLSTPAPAGGVTLNLSSDATDMATITPASIFIPAGATTPATLPTLTGNQLGYADITASASGYLASTLQIHVTDDITIGLQDLVTVAVGQTTPYIVALPGAAPQGGVTVTLTSSDTTKLTVPASVTIPAGALLAPVPIQVTGVAPGSVQIRGSAPGYSTETQTVTVVAAQ